jgi:hypothetical protein
MSSDHDQNSRSEDSKATCGLNPPLLFDVIGPFVSHFQAGILGHPGTVCIYAPICEGHHANIITDSDDISLYGLSAQGPLGGSGHVYGFVDGNSPLGTDKYCCDGDDDKKLLVVSCDLPTTDKSQCHLTFRVPCPDRIVPLHNEEVFIHRNGSEYWVSNPDSDPYTSYGSNCAHGADVVNSPRARGLRFLYLDCQTPPKLHAICGKEPERLRHISAETLGYPGSPAPYTMTLRFSSNSSDPDEHHEDAYNCFQTMRLLMGDEFYKWRTDFDDMHAASRTKWHIESKGSNPRDCGASALMLQDW